MCVLHKLIIAHLNIYASKKHFLKQFGKLDVTTRISGISDDGISGDTTQ